MRSPAFVAAVVLVLVFLASAGGGAAARPVVRSEGGSDVALDRVVAAEFTDTDSSAQPSNCTCLREQHRRPVPSHSQRWPLTFGKFAIPFFF
jgi:hypothetical protein